MKENEIKALITLLDDNDQEVFDHVAEKLFSLGPQVIEHLEDAYTMLPNPIMQERIEELIHKIQFDQVTKDLKHWNDNETDDLLKGVLIVTRHQYPDLDEYKIIKSITKIKKDIWIGLNNYLSPLEQMNIFNQTLFTHYQFQGLQNQENELTYVYLNNALNTLKGNHFSTGLLYLILCQQLEIPVYGVCLSSHFILARTKDYISNFADKEKNRNDVLFYINPYNRGLAFSDREISTYLSKLDIEVKGEYFLPASNKAVLKEYINYLIRMYVKPDEVWKVEDLYNLSLLIDED